MIAVKITATVLKTGEEEEIGVFSHGVTIEHRNLVGSGRKAIFLIDVATSKPIVRKWGTRDPVWVRPDTRINSPEIIIYKDLFIQGVST